MFVLKDGRVCRHRTVDLDLALPRAQDLMLKGSVKDQNRETEMRSPTEMSVLKKSSSIDFDIQLLQSNKLIFISNDLNLKFY